MSLQRPKNRAWNTRGTCIPEIATCHFLLYSIDFGGDAVKSGQLYSSVSQ